MKKKHTVKNKALGLYYRNAVFHQSNFFKWLVLHFKWVLKVSFLKVFYRSRYLAIYLKEIRLLKLFFF